MFTVKADKAILHDLAAMLADEEPGSCLRIKEFNLGGG